MVELTGSETGTDYSDHLRGKKIENSHDDQQEQHHEVKHPRGQNPCPPVFSSRYHSSERRQKCLFHHVFTENASKQGGDGKSDGKNVSGSAGTKITSNDHLPHKTKHSGDQVPLNHVKKFSKKGLPHEFPAFPYNHGQIAPGVDPKVLVFLSKWPRTC